MLYAIVSDIHSNLEALSTVPTVGMDAVYCVGDVVGYGPNPNECCEMVREKHAVTILGNHDAAVIGTMPLEWFNPAAREAAEWTRAQLTAENRLFLESLPLVSRSEHFIMVHGSLSAPERFEYITSPWEARPTFDSMDPFDLCFVGHSHVAEYYARKVGEMGADQIMMIGGGIIDLKPGFRYIVNPGSVGQPRDGNPHAAFAVYDTDAQTVEICRVEYPISVTQEKMRSAGLPDPLITRLEYGW